MAIVLSNVTVLCSLAGTMSVSADTESGGTYKIVDAPANAEYYVYKDVSKNYIYDDFEDVYVGSLVCDEYGTGSIEGLQSGDYIAVLKDSYTNLTTDSSYAFTSNGDSVFTQEANTEYNFGIDTVGDIDYSNSAGIECIMYNVPLYKQSGMYASDWNTMYINNSSDTMGNVGCLICSFAMVRSYEEGRSIFPDEMANSYSASTNVGVSFASNYNCAMNVPLSASNYGWNIMGSTMYYGGNGEIANNQTTNNYLLNYLYAKLQTGPVIFGGYSTYNGRGLSNHWIVVKGYIGNGENLSANDFYICDPANNNGVNRETLAQYLEKYPYWDRMIFSDVNYKKMISLEQYKLGYLNSPVTRSSANFFEPVVGESEDIVGDIDLNGKVSINDCVLLKNYLMGVKELQGRALANADYNGDGKVSSIDLFSLKRHLLTY